MTAPNTDAPAKITLRSIYFVFFQIGMFAFGGGLQSWVYREAVERRSWVNDREYVSGLAMSQILPGTNVGNLSIYLGLRQRGLAGAAVALAGLITVPFFAAILLYLAYDQIANNRWVDAALTGVTAVAMGLLLRMGLRSGAKGSEGIGSVVVIAALFLMVGILQWPLLLVVAGATPVSIALAWLRLRGTDAQ
ncbi:MAG TPA: chromate transporter [Devosia sp.]|nr:chromate transporter [Devosia sp.]